MSIGINTKVAQTVATSFDIPVDMVVISALSTEKIANGGVTGECISSVIDAYSVSVDVYLCILQYRCI